MSAIECRFLEPLDVLFLRGNTLYGDAGSFGEALVPPWPSVVAGALRSRMLVDEGVDLMAFARGDAPHPELGTPQAPGSFTVVAFHLARFGSDGAVEVLIQVPADLVISEDSRGRGDCVKALVPGVLPQGAALDCSSTLPLLPILAEAKRTKPVSGYWLTQAGWKKYLAGETPNGDDLVSSAELWTFDYRVGVGLDTVTRRAADGRLFSMQAVALRRDVGFLVAVVGASPPAHGTVRLGGDGRAAAVRVAPAALPKPDYSAIAHAGRCRLVLTSPGVFANGWLPNGITRNANGEYRFDLHGVKARLVCAAVPRAEVVSGWDMVKRRPKAAERVAPTGSVYWLDALDATSEALCKLVSNGLWNEPCEDSARRAEGFNRFMLAAY